MSQGKLVLEFEKDDDAPHCQDAMEVTLEVEGCPQCLIAAIARLYNRDKKFRKWLNGAINFSRESPALGLEDWQNRPF